ncbi:hypothetical protein [Paraburkholderia fynbosensis]|uniref:Uncharacterized protein n=1 Tax=Paraburkholderia fynbosensis TaxID=1200993 RepID=A0A6J5FN44_9BURK|nr:hypothetical protein [Paraburkholderia fynbosensis]CAB3782036.1 hypothetical protein LMG27177_01150 [Paraburkholderia fynbosensis]
MSALDDIIARDSAPQGLSQLDAIIARDAHRQNAVSALSSQAAASPKVTAPAAASIATVAVSPDDALAQDLTAGGASPYAWDEMRQIGSGAWHGVSSLVNNAANLVEKGVAGGANFIPGMNGSAIGNWLTNTANDDVAAQSAADQRFKQTASPGEQASAIVAPLLMPMGSVAKVGSAVKGGVSALPMMSGAVGRVVGTGLGNAATGAVSTAGADVDANQPYWSQIGRNLLAGGVVGAALPAVFSGTKSVGTNLYDAARPIFNPAAYVGKGLAASLGDDAATVAAQIRTAPIYLPGSMPTTAQAAPNPTLVATEKASANGVPGFKIAMEERANANNQARWDALGGVAQTPQALRAAVQARDQAAGPLYDAARFGMYDVDPDLEALMRRPAMQQALQRGTSIASNEGNAGFLNAITPIAPTTANVPTGGVGFNGAPLMQQIRTSPGTRGQPARITGDVLHYLKLGMDDLQASARENTRLGPQERRAINQAQGDFLDWLDNASPDYAVARATYAGMSPPINSMQAGQEIAGRLGGAGRPLNSSGTPLMTAPGYAVALSQALRNQEFGIESGAQQTLENIGRDLQRSTVSNSIRAGSGSDTAYNLQANGWLARKLYGADFQGGTVGKLLGTAVQAGGAAGGAALFGPTGAGVGSAIGSGIGSLFNGARVNSRLNRHLGELLLNPHALLPYLHAGSTLPAQVRNQALGQALLRNIYPAAAGAVARSGLINSN